MAKKIIKIVPYIVSVILLIALIITVLNNKSINVTYEQYLNTVNSVISEFQPKGFISLNKIPSYDYSKITSYPSKEWTSEDNNSYNGDVLKPKQIDLYFINEENQNTLTKITFFYAPDSKKRDYIKIDYFDSDSLMHISSIDEKYKNIAVVPHYEVAFKGKGYYAYVQTTYLETYYKSKFLMKDDTANIISINADMVRQLQHFLITK